MATKPTTVPRWAETAVGAPAANITVPISAEQDVGWTNGQNPVSSGKLNWLFRFLYDWVLYLKDAIFVADTGSAKAGIDATGDGATPGGKFTPGGGGTPARGAVNLPAQAAPTAPSNGDVWTTAAALFARINGATKTQAALETAQTFTQPQTLTGSVTRAPLNLVPQAAPSTPADGDTWITTAGIFARVNGVTIQLLDFANTRVAKAWAVVTLGAAGAATITNGFNVASASYAAADLTITFTSALANANYVVAGQVVGNTGLYICPEGNLVGSFQLHQHGPAGSTNWINGQQILVVVFGP